MWAQSVNSEISLSVQAKQFDTTIDQIYCYSVNMLSRLNIGVPDKSNISNTSGRMGGHIVTQESQTLSVSGGISFSVQAKQFKTKYGQNSCKLLKILASLRFTDEES